MTRDEQHALLVAFGWWMREEPGVTIASVHTPVGMATRFLAARPPLGEPLCSTCGSTVEDHNTPPVPRACAECGGWNVHQSSCHHRQPLYGPTALVTDEQRTPAASDVEHAEGFDSAVPPSVMPPYARPAPAKEMP